MRNFLSMSRLINLIITFMFLALCIFPPATSQAFCSLDDKPQLAKKFRDIIGTTNIDNLKPLECRTAQQRLMEKATSGFFNKEQMPYVHLLSGFLLSCTSMAEGENIEDSLELAFSANSEWKKALDRLQDCQFPYLLMVQFYQAIKDYKKAYDLLQEGLRRGVDFSSYKDILQQTEKLAENVWTKDHAMNFIQKISRDYDATESGRAMQQVAENVTAAIDAGHFTGETLGHAYFFKGLANGWLGDNLSAEAEKSFHNKTALESLYLSLRFLPNQYLSHLFLGITLASSYKDYDRAKKEFDLARSKAPADADLSVIDQVLATADQNDSQVNSSKEYDPATDQNRENSLEFTPIPFE